MRQVRISEGMGLSDFAKFEAHLQSQLQAQSESMDDEADAEVVSGMDNVGLDDLGKRKSFFKRLRKLAPHNILKRLDPIQMLMRKKHRGGGGEAPVDTSAAPAPVPGAPPTATDASGNPIPYTPGVPYPPVGVPLSPTSQAAVATGTYAAYGTPPGGAAPPPPPYPGAPGYPSAPMPSYPGAPMPGGGGGGPPLPSAEEPPLPSAAEPPLPSAEEAPEEAPEEGGGGEEGPEGGPPKKAAAPKPPAGKLPAPAGTTVLVSETTPWVKYALIAGGVIAVGLAVYFFVIKKKK
jgi:hypothetical protein